MKKALKIIFYPIFFLFSLIGIYFLAAWALSSITIEKQKDGNEEVEIFIKTNGVHTDLVLPIKSTQVDWSKEIKFKNIKSKDSLQNYLALGWGNKGFYLETREWADLKASVAFKAAFGLSGTAIHATFYKQMPEGTSCKKMKISQNQYKKLIRYIDETLKKDEKGHYIAISTNANYGNSDAFYEANGSYSLFHTCNTWANNGLKECGQKCCFWTPFDKGIFSKY